MSNCLIDVYLSIDEQFNEAAHDGNVDKGSLLLDSKASIDHSNKKNHSALAHGMFLLSLKKYRYF